MIFVGIDPGLDGAVALIEVDGIGANVIGAVDVPTLDVGKKRDYNIAGMVAIFTELTGETLYAALESVHSMPKQGVASSFNFGRGLGIWEGLLAGLSIPYTKVAPQRWKKVMMDGMPKEKDASRLRAIQLFPAVASDLGLKKHHGRADALLMAEWLRRTHRGAISKATDVASHQGEVLRGC